MRSNGQSVTLNSVTMEKTHIKHKASVCVCITLYEDVDIELLFDI